MTGQPLSAQDEEHLRLLVLFHYIVGGIIAALSSVFLVHVVIGLTMIFHPSAFPSSPGSPPMPGDFGYLFVAMGSVAVLGGWTLAGLNIFAGRCLRDRKRYVLVLVVAGIDCLLAMPLGTVLGVFTFIVLTRPAVRALFDRG